jgi:hypothetical protein
MHHRKVFANVGIAFPYLPVKEIAFNHFSSHLLDEQKYGRWARSSVAQQG